MNGLRLKFQKKREEVRKHLGVLERAFRALHEKLGPSFNEETMERAREDPILLPYLDQVAYRFSRLQDSLGDLLRLYLLIKGESVENLPMLDLVNLAEKRGLSVNGERWWHLRRLRNILVHEYPEEDEEVARALREIESELSGVRKLLAEMEDGLSTL
ncbi:hypothetical protein [Thermosulfurimonas sp. F29]|uniref:hypothetical protein n=1 Tax=Thermosulfurimonas sp. F29 TaxID=2867247 RepID=UPI001C83E030|nr:hypothetical protein [Thermosulfurimonas sp. F29]MBX6422554.1 hypothetical protein [Thermosulfurimonas sp. F29]